MTTPIMPPRRFSQRLYLDEDLPETSTQNHPPAQIVSNIVEGLEHPTLNDILEVEVLHPANSTSITVAGSSQNARDASSTQTNGGAPHQSPLQVPSPIHVIQGNVEIEKIQMEDWEDEAFEDEATIEAELSRVH
jgi:hypothetical protein